MIRVGPRHVGWMSALTATALWLAAAPGIDEANAAFFMSPQKIECWSSGWSFVGIWSYTTGSWMATYDNRNLYSVSYELPYGVWLGIFIYDYDAGFFDEVLYITDFNLP